MTDRRRDTALILFAAAAAVLTTYRATLGGDVMLDDYIALRPRAAAELWTVWHATWEPRGMWPVFYRPLSIWYYAALFHLFGLASLPLRIITLIELTGAAWGVGIFVRRDAGSLALGLFAAVLCAVHPGLAHAGVAFIFLQNHLASLLVAVAVLLGWQSRRDTPTVRAWLPLLCLIVVGTLIKEDVLMLAPILLALQYSRAALARDVPMPGRRIVVTMVAMCAGYVLLRSEMLGELGGFREHPDVMAALRNLTRGTYRTLIDFKGVNFENTTALETASLISCGWVVLGAMAWRRTCDPIRQHLCVSGLILIAGFSAPLLLMSNMWRYHLVTLGASLVVVSAVALVMKSAGSVVLRVAGAGGAAVTLALMALASDAIVGPLSPCSASTLALDREVSAEGSGGPATGDSPAWRIPAEELAWLHAKAAACSQSRTPRFTQSVDVVTWDLDPSSFTSLIAERARAVQIVVRDPAASSSTPRVVRVRADGRDVSVTQLVSPEWRTIVVPVGDSMIAHLRQMHRIDVVGEAGSMLSRQAVAIDD